MSADPASARILVIDDNVTFCRVLERALQRRKFTIAVAHNAETALATAAEFRPTHTIVDLKLGNDSGLHLIKPLLEVSPEMQILMLTGYGSIPTAVEAVKTGAINYLAKPVDVDTILANFGSEIRATKPHETAPSRMSLKRLEWEHIQRVLDEHDGNISAAARSLNMHRRTLQRKLQKRPVKQ
ncbi:MAG: response regulator [Candidatus Polarisedimenticolaceae bacterium]|nr:response regulator [Candidatus Polarisedimenticolaceae bacterium]